LLKSIDEYTEEWINEYLIPQRPELVDTYRAAFEGYKHLSKGFTYDKESLEAILVAISSKSSVLADNSIRFISETLPYIHEVREAVSNLLEDKRMHVRFNALRTLSVETQREFSLKLLSLGLQDPSYKVRKFASYISRIIKLVEIIPIMEKAYKLEKNPKAKTEIRYNLRLFRDGYCIKRFNNQGIPLLWINTGDEGVHGIDIKITKIPYVIKLLPKMFKRNES